MDARALIFRLNLFKVTEPFILNQVSHYQRYTPVFAGHHMEGPVPDGMEAHVLPSGVRRRHRWLTRARIRYDPGRDYSALLKRIPFDVIHAHFGTNAVQALRVADRSGAPLVTTFHGYDATRAMHPARWPARAGAPALYANLRPQLQAQGAAFVCVSNFIRESVVAQGYDADRCIVHHMGIDTDRFPARGHQPEAPRILTIGRLVEKKGTADLLRALQVLRRHIPDVRLDVVGTGPLEEALRVQATERGVQEHVTFHGNIPFDDLQRLFDEAAVFCLPSVTAADGDSEGLPTVLMEASAREIPCVATHHSGIPDVIKDGMNGLLVKEHDVDALAEALRRVLDDQKRARDMGRAGRRVMLRDFDVRRQSPKLETLYDQVREGSFR